MARSTLQPPLGRVGCAVWLALLATGCFSPDITHGDGVQLRPRVEGTSTDAPIAGGPAFQTGGTGTAGDVALAGTGGMGSAGEPVELDAEVPWVEPDAGAGEPIEELDGGEPPLVSSHYCDAVPAELLEPRTLGQGADSQCPARACEGRVWSDVLGLSSPADLDAHTAPISADEYAGCTLVTGDVVINVEMASDLAALRCLERVDGSFTIWNGGNLQSLDGLEHLSFVGADFRISRQPPYRPLQNSITRIDGLRSLEAVGGTLAIHAPGLTSLSGLESLRAIGSGLEIEEPTVLPDMTGLGSLRAIGRNLRLSGIDTAPLQTTLVGLEQLETIGGSLELMGGVTLSAFGEVLPNVTCLGGGLYIPGPNDNLIAIDFLPRLSRVGGHVVLNGNAALRTVTALRGVEHIRGSIQISGNTALEELDLSSLKKIDGSMLVVGNSAFDDCALMELAHRIGADADIHDNAFSWFGCGWP